MKHKKKGLFISFEGPEASGKSTQIKLLSNFLKKNKIPYLITREPGGTEIGEKLRKIILNKKDNISNTEEILLLMSARLNHINNIRYIIFFILLFFYKRNPNNHRTIFTIIPSIIGNHF